MTETKEQRNMTLLSDEAYDTFFQRALNERFLLQGTNGYSREIFINEDHLWAIDPNNGTLMMVIADRDYMNLVNTFPPSQYLLTLT